MTDPTAKQAAVYAAIVRYYVEHGYPPTVREIGELVGIGSTNGVCAHTRALQHKGWLPRCEKRSRGLFPLRKLDGTDVDRGCLKRAFGVEA